MRPLALALFLSLPTAAQPAPSASAHRLMVVPTARPVPTGGVRLGVTAGVIPTGSVGIGKGASLTVGVLPLPNRNTRGVVIAEPKVTVLDRPRLAVAVGATGHVRYLYKPRATVLPYAVATVDAGPAQATLGLGGRIDVNRATIALEPGESGFYVPGQEQDLSTHLVRAPTVFGGATFALSRRVSVVTEVTAVPFSVASGAAPDGQPGAPGRERRDRL